MVPTRWWSSPGGSSSEGKGVPKPNQASMIPAKLRRFIDGLYSCFFIGDDFQAGSAAFEMSRGGGKGEKEHSRQFLHGAHITTFGTGADLWW